MRQLTKTLPRTHPKKNEQKSFKITQHVLTASCSFFTQQGSSNTTAAVITLFAVTYCTRIQVTVVVATGYFWSLYPQVAKKK